MTHPPNEQLQRYYDGELPADERLTIQTHLADCPPCKSHLAQLGGLSQMLLSVDLPEFSAGARQRTLSALKSVRTDLGLRHLAEWVSAVAALIIVGMMILPAQKSTKTQVSESTETADVGYIDTVAVTPPTTHTGSNRQLVQFAEFMAGDVSGGVSSGTVTR